MPSRHLRPVPSVILPIGHGLCNARHSLHRRVWYRALSLRTQSFTQAPSHSLTHSPNLFDVPGTEAFASEHEAIVRFVK